MKIEFVIVDGDGTEHEYDEALFATPLARKTAPSLQLAA